METQIYLDDLDFDFPICNIFIKYYNQLKL